jgi:hypothetical protein
MLRKQTPSNRTQQNQRTMMPPMLKKRRTGHHPHEMGQSGRLQGVIENTLEILGLQTKIIEGLATGGMMKIRAQA